MRVGKKKSVVEVKQTRSCVVKVENMKTPPLSKPRGRISIGTSSKMHSPQDDTNFKGPIKKRPITVINTPIGKDKSRMSTPAKGSTSKIHLKNESTPIVVDTPTIAAGRSRRAIKPNPKYASEDILTPKIIKNVSMLSTGGSSATTSASTSMQKKPTNLKQRKLSSSSDDFFNRDSSDDIEDQDEVYDLEDSDYSEDLDEAELKQEIRGRGRPRKYDIDSTPRPKSITTPISAAKPKAIAAPVSVSKGKPIAISAAAVKLRPAGVMSAPRSTAVKTTPSQLQQLRKTLVAHPAIRLPLSSMKRKRDSFSNDSESDASARKRPNISLKTNKEQKSDTEKEDNDDQSNDSKVTRKSLAAKPMESNKKISNIPQKGKAAVIEIDDDDEISTTTKSASIKQSKTIVKSTKLRNSPQQKIIVDQTEIKLTKVLSRQTRSKSPLNSTSSSSTKPLGNSSKSPKNDLNTNTTTNDKTESETEKDMLDISQSELDDFEQMPTFTIVNINDIINKKGDVLINKSPKNNQSPSNKSQKADTPTTSPIAHLSGKAKVEVATESRFERKSSRRKADHTTILSEKIDPEILKNPRPRSPFPPKKATSTILNNLKASSNKSKDDSNKSKVDGSVVMQRQTRAAVAAKSPEIKSKSAEKQAPRILNSMVAKKTQPVKPMINNMEDSADEGMSMEEDDFQFDMDNDDDEEIKDIDPDEEEVDNRKTTLKKRNNNSQPPRTLNKYLGSNKNAPATKENSLAALNRQTASKIASSLQRKHTPEKVVISRQGDTIIKKITCFETWFVINPPEEQPPQPMRNQLDMPLIKLANLVNDIKVPSDNWTSKVSLTELSAVTLAKATLPTYTGDLNEHNISEEDRGKYQPSCVMFRRTVEEREKSRLPYDRAVIFKNKTFFTNIDGKNVKLIGAPIAINSQAEVEILLAIVDSLTLESSLVEQVPTSQ